MTIETAIESHPELTPFGEIETLRRGSFGLDGRRVRVAVFSGGLLWEQAGQTVVLKGELA